MAGASSKGLTGAEKASAARGWRGVVRLKFGSIVSVTIIKAFYDPASLQVRRKRIRK